MISLNLYSFSEFALLEQQVRNKPPNFDSKTASSCFPRESTSYMHSFLMFLYCVRDQTKVIKRDAFKVLRGERPPLAAKSFHHGRHNDLVPHVDLVIIACCDSRLHPTLDMWPHATVVLLDGVKQTRGAEAAAVVPVCSKHGKMNVVRACKQEDAA